jgi:hypothetical protein
MTNQGMEDIIPLFLESNTKLVMKDLKNMFIYGGLSFGVIVLLVVLATTETASSDVVGVLAILTVIVLPVVLSVFIGKKDKQRQQGESK